ncbi:MAG TPA: YceI family protein [Terriglobales bacterium]
MRRFTWCWLAVLALASSAWAADEYKIDPVHSRVGFAVKHMVINTVHGRFTDFNGAIQFDDKDPSKSSVAVTIKTASINTDNPQRDNDLRSANFLEVEKYPEITFKSKSVEKKGNGFVAHGALTIKAVSQDVDLAFTLGGPLDTGRGKLLGAEAGLTINRQDYGVTWSRTLAGGELIVANDVVIEINVEARQAAPAPAAK